MFTVYSLRFTDDYFYRQLSGRARISSVRSALPLATIGTQEP